MMLRKTPLLLLATGFVLGSSTIVKAELDPLLKAGIVLRTFDQLSAGCQADRGFNSRESTAIAQWQSANNVAAVRAQVDALPPATQKELTKDANDVVQSITQQVSASPCLFALKVTELDQAQFAKTLPLVQPTPPISSTPVAPTPVTPVTPVVPNPVAPVPVIPNPVAPAPVPNSAVVNLVATIDSFGFNTTTGFGVGGWVTQEVVPVVLFRNGEALKEVKGLNYPGGLEAHRRDRPQDWTQWRRNDGRVELVTKNGWKKLAFAATYPTLPSNFRLAGSYRSLSGTGTVAIGGDSSVAAWRDYAFSTEGQVVRNGGAGASAGNVVTTGTNPSQQGRYEVDGLILRMRFDDASVEERIIITNPQDPKSAIWLDGVGYSKRK